MRRWCTTSVENANWVLLITRPDEFAEHIEEAKRLLAAGASVSAVANELGYGWAMSFSKTFRKHVGCSPTEWIATHGTRASREDRVSRAEALLLTGEHSVRDVGRLVGFNSYQGLTNAFKAVHGVSPFQWVKRHREQVPIEVMAIPRPRLIKLK
jgi:AraC-like DNA-binding protein